MKIVDYLCRCWRRFCTRLPRFEYRPGPRGRRIWWATKAHADELLAAALAPESAILDPTPPKLVAEDMHDFMKRDFKKKRKVRTVKKKCKGKGKKK